MTTGKGDYLDFGDLQKGGTGDRESLKDVKTIVVPFGQYEIVVELTLNDEFIGIQEIRLNEDFRNWKQKIMTSGYHDVDEFYHD